jgi:hypothetical protein
VIPGAYVFHASAISVIPWIANLPELPAMLGLLIGSLAAILMSMLVISRMAGALDVAEQRLRMQAWQLRQLIADDDVAPAAPKQS